MALESQLSARTKVGHGRRDADSHARKAPRDFRRIVVELTRRGMTYEIAAVLKAWQLAAAGVARSPELFNGRDKEKKVLRKLRLEIEHLDPEFSISGPDSQVRFNRWGIDLECCSKDHRVAIEGKFKTASDGAVPDNRKAAFFDLYKLEQYLASRQYSAGVFLWLTDVAGYRQQATAESADFSTHQGREYRAGTALRAARARNPMPLPLTLRSDFRFDWTPVDTIARWHRLEICQTLA